MRSKREDRVEPWFSVTLSSINRRTEPVSRGKRQHLSKSTLRKLSTLFQAQIANDEDAFAEISNLQTKVKSRQDKIDRLREELAFFQGNEMNELAEIQARIQELKYQFQISQNLLEQTEQELSFAEHRKINIIKGDFKGDPTLSKVQQEGFLNLSSDNQHALEFLARELGILITPGEMTKADVQEIMSVASSSLIQLQSMRDQAESVKRMVERKLEGIRSSIEDSKARRQQLITEIVDLQTSLMGTAPVVYSTIPFAKVPPADAKSIRTDMLHVLSVAGKRCDSQDLDDIADAQRRCILQLARKLSTLKKEHKFLSEMRTPIPYTPHINTLSFTADKISDANLKLSKR